MRMNMASTFIRSRLDFSTVNILHFQRNKTFRMKKFDHLGKNVVKKDWEEVTGFAPDYRI